MTSDREMEDFARECVHLANLTADPRMRERLFQMAREWMAMAMHEKKVPEPQFSLACCVKYGVSSVRITLCPKDASQLSIRLSCKIGVPFQPIAVPARIPSA